MQQPVSYPVVACGRVKRADECRLLFLSRSDHHARTSVCQWRPFGTTSVKDLDVGVRAHAECGGHGLQYQGLRWTGDEATILSTTDGVKPATDRSTLHASNGPITVSYEKLNRENEVNLISENTTRSILGWLRPDGQTLDEREVFQHPWLDMSDSDPEDEVRALADPNNIDKDASLVTLWLDNLDYEEQS